jgi:hypothetical protein
MAALDLLLQNASGVVDSTVIQSLRDQIASIALQVHHTPATGSLGQPAQGQLTTVPCLLLGGQSDRPTKGSSTEWSNTKTDLTAELHSATQSRQQACTSAALAAKALFEATGLLASAPAQEGLEDTVKQAAKLVEDTDAAAKCCLDAENKAAADLQAHKNTT